jgi:hypothetical protein
MIVNSAVSLNALPERKKDSENRSPTNGVLLGKIKRPEKQKSYQWSALQTFHKKIAL